MIVDLYMKRETVDKVSFLASFEDIEKNDFNLNIPRYVDNFEKEEPVDINALLGEMKQTDEEIQKVQNELISMLCELTSSDEDINVSLNECIKVLKGEF